MISAQLLLMNWWGLLLRGLLAVVFGILTLAMPGLTLTALVWLFAGYALIEGVVNIVSGVRARHGHTRWWLLLLEGLVSIAAGLIAIAWPGVTALALVFVIAFWALFTGVLEIAAAIHLRKQIEGEWLLALGGVLSIALGILLLLFPGAGALAMVLWIGVYAIIFGISLVFLGIRVRLRAQPWAPATAREATPEGPSRDRQIPAH
ncbi:MAG: HdeD family acid-resistance protein [Polyangiaceae bacterium]